MRKTEKSALIAVGLGYYEPWITILKDGQERTWLAENRPHNLRVRHFFGNPVGAAGIKIDQIHERIRFSSRIASIFLRFFDLVLLLPAVWYEPKISEVEIEGVRDIGVQVDFPDTYLSLRWKMLGLFEYFLSQTDDDFLIVTTSSSYLNLNLLAQKLFSSPTSGLYFGPQPYKSADFVSGSFRLFSRDVVELIYAHRRKWDFTLLEDVAIGKLLKSLQVKPTFTISNNLDSESAITSLDDKYIQNQVHFRLKSGSHEVRNDVRLMNFLHSRLSRHSK